MIAGLIRPWYARTSDTNNLASILVFLFYSNPQRFSITHGLGCSDIRVQKRNMFFQFGFINKCWSYESTIPIRLCFLIFIAPNVVLVANFFIQNVCKYISQRKRQPLFNIIYFLVVFDQQRILNVMNSKHFLIVTFKFCFLLL